MATPAAAPATPAEPDDMRAELRAMHERMAAQEQELARQRQEIEALRSDAAQRAASESSDAQAEALIQSAEQDADVQEIAEEDPLRVYGFMDVGWQKTWGPLMERGFGPSEANTFVLGNVNVYLDAHPMPDWRSLVEVRFTNLPQGADSFDSATATTTRAVSNVQDTTATHGGLVGIDLNGVILERAHIDYTPLDWFNVRAGLFLTPYGIWNVDHGAPVRIMARPPAYIVSNDWPERQIGIDFFGNIDMLPWQLEYHAYVSNGRQLGAIDFDEDKAIGARLALGTRRPFAFKVGASFFKGSSEDQRIAPGVTASGMLGLIRSQPVAYDETGGAGDLSIDIERLRFRTEIVVVNKTFVPGKRETFGGSQTPDTTSVGAYALLAYELPWYAIEPYAAIEHVLGPVPTLADGFDALTGGINLYFTAATQLRLFATHSWAFALDRPNPKNCYTHGVGTRLVVAF